MFPPLRTYTPRDIWAGNQLLPLLQAQAREEWNRQFAAPAAPEAAPVEGPIQLFRQAMAPAGAPSPYAPQRAPGAPIQMFRPPSTAPRRATGMSARTAAPGIPAPNSPRGPSPTSSEPGQIGSGGFMGGMSGDERSMMLASQLGGAAQGLLSAGPRASIGRMLLGAGAGLMGGQAQGLQGIRMGRRADAQDRLLERRIAGEEAELDMQQRQRQAVQAMLDDPNVPQTQKNLLKLSMAGVPAGAITAMTPQQMTPYQQESLRLREQEIAARGARGGGARSEPLVPVYDPESGRTTYAPRSQAVGMTVPPKGAGGLSDAQQRLNSETMAARQQLEQLGIDRDAALSMSQEYLPTGLPNPDYNPNVRSLVGKATRRMYGDDPTHAAWLERIYNAPESPASDASAEAEPTSSPEPASQGSSLGQRVAGFVSGLFGGEETAHAGGGPPAAAPRRQPARPITPTPRAGEAQSVPASGGKIDRAKLRTGVMYTLPDGRTVRWTGSDFEIAE